MSMHVVFVMANNSSVPYFSWFAERAENDPRIKLSFVALHAEKPKMLEEMPRWGAKAYWIPFDNQHRKWSMAKAIAPLRRLFRSLRPDIVHTHLFDDAVPTLIAARLAGISRRVITKQDTTYHWFYAPKGVKFDRMNNRLATHLIAVSKECESFLLQKERAPAEKMHMIHHGIPFEKLGKQDEQTKIALSERFDLKDKIVVGAVARYIEWKGLHFLIEAAPALVKEYPSMRFVLAGMGPEEDRLRKMAKALGVEQHVIFTGWIEKTAIPSLYGLMDIYLHTALYEPFGFVIPEAMINEVPVVSTKTGSAADAIAHKENGYLTPYKDPQAIVEGICWMMEQDKKDIGRKGREKAEQLYSFDNMYQNYLALYEEAMGS